MIRREVSVWPPPALHAFRRRPVAALPYPLEEKNCSLFSLGRHALWHGIRALGLKPGDEILVPAFNHGSEVEAFVRAGIEPRFYEATESLEPDPAQLERMATPRTKALHLIHYLGWPQDAARWREWSDERGLSLIEDAAQSWLASRRGHPVGSFGHMAIFCLYKTYGIPDGAALVCSRSIPDVRSRPAVAATAIVKRELSLRNLRRRRNHSPETLRAFELGDVNKPPSLAAMIMLRRLADERTALERRDNYAYLLAQVHGHVPKPFDRLPEGASPFALPIETTNKHALIDALRREHVRAESFWSTPHPAVPAEGFPGATERRARTVALPVYQGVPREWLDTVARLVTSRSSA